MASPPTGNILLSALDPEEMAYIWAWFQEVPLQSGNRLIEPLSTITHAYFVDSGILSVTAASDGKNSFEISCIGREGMAGFPLLFGCDQSPNLVKVIRSGKARRIEAKRLLDALAAFPNIRRVLSPYGQVLETQVAEAGRSAARNVVDERVARWLLMIHDRSEGDEIFVTHDAIARSLGIRRPGVTVALHVLEGQHLVRAGRGIVRVLDRFGLERAAAGSYGRAEAEYARLYPGRRADDLPSPEFIAAAG